MITVYYLFYGFVGKEVEPYFSTSKAARDSFLADIIAGSDKCKARVEISAFTVEMTEKKWHEILKSGNYEQPPT